MRKYLILGIVGMLMLTGCSAVAPQTGSPLGDITQLTVTDLQAALARATAANDLPAMQCYPALIGIVQSLPGKAPNLEVAGVADAFEAARLLSKKLISASGATNPMVQQINLACAALFNDAQGDVLRLGVKFRP